MMFEIQSVEEAVKFMEKSAKSGPVDYSDMEEMEWELAMLWEDGKQEARANIVEREARFLDAKIRLFWVSIHLSEEHAYETSFRFIFSVLIE